MEEKVEMLSLKAGGDGGMGKSRGGDSKGPSIEGAESWKEGVDGVDVYIGH